LTTPATPRARETALRLYTPTGEEPGPFLKWAGGKTQLLPQLEKFFPTRIPRYHEPFLGGGAVFFFLRGRGWLTGPVTLSDSNAELVNAYTVVRDDVDALVCHLARHRAAHSKDHFYSVRALPFTPDAAGAARMIYLNKTGFNGLYRVNSKGQFNVPLGSYTNPSVYDEAALRRASRALQGVRLVVQDALDSLAEAGAGDLLYLDPPYVPLSATASFTGYVPGGFGPADQERLADAVRAADGRGARFVLSNSDTPAVRRLYLGFRIESVPARRMINCDAARRGEVNELIVAGIEAPMI